MGLWCGVSVESVRKEGGKEVQDLWYGVRMGWVPGFHQ